MYFPKEFFYDEVREGFFVSSMMKRCWAAQLELVSDIDRVCETLGIKYFAAWGTLLGAWRHQGYIPWDDDLDLCMLRPDYERFLAEAPALLAPTYQISGFHNATTDYANNVTRVHVPYQVTRDKKNIDKFHGYPYVVSVDIFVFDYLEDDPATEQANMTYFEALQAIALSLADGTMSQAEKHQAVAAIQDSFGVTIDPAGSMVNQCLALSFARAKATTKGAYVASLYHRSTHKARFDRDHRFPAELFEDMVRVPFEHVTIPVPKDMEAILALNYKTYFKAVRRPGSHRYPTYRNQEEDLLAAGYPPLFHQATYDASKLPQKEKRPTVVRDILAGLLDTLTGVQQGLPQLICENPQEALFLLEDIQDAVISVGTNIETLYGEGHPTVKTLEGYCEALYVLHERILDELEVTDSIATLDDALATVQASATDHILSRKEIIFCPYTARDWDAIAPVYAAAKADPTCDVYVIPLMYKEVELDGNYSPRGICHEMDAFPPDVDTISSREFPWEAHSLDVIYIQDPYDADSLTHNVDPNYYSHKLAAMTPHLVCIPPIFLHGGYGPTDQVGPRGLMPLTNTSGMANADHIVVQGPVIRDVFIENLTAWAGADTRPVWEKKVCAFGTPLRDVAEGARIHKQVMKLVAADAD